MMFLWKPDMIRFMRDASEHTGYHADLAARIVPHLKEGARVCDAGCGLGYLSLALAPLAAQVTAVDRNADALSVLRENCEKYFGCEPDSRGFENARSGLSGAKRALLGGKYNSTTYKGWQVLPTDDDKKGNQ